MRSPNAQWKSTVSAEDFDIEVIYIETDKNFIKKITISENTSIQQAIQLSGVLTEFPDLSLETIKAGMFGKAKPLDSLLKNDDRVEIFRTLQVDPKESRRRRAKLKVGQAKK